MAHVIFQSDALSPLRDLIADLTLLDPHFAVFLDMPRQYLVVIDTSDIMDDLHWRVTHCKDHTARMPLQEAIDSGTIIAIAPHQLLDEVKSKIPMRAARWKTTEDELWQEWAQYQERIQFCDVDPARDIPNHLFRDPTDLSFIDLCSRSGADAIVTADKDIAAMGAKTVGRETIMALRDYARAESVVLHIKLGGFIVTVVITEGTKVLWALLITLGRTFVRLPVWLQLTLLAAFSTGAIHPRSRALIGELVSSGSENLSTFATGVRSIVGSASQMYAAESVKLADAEARVYEALPQLRRQPSLEAVAFSVCYASGKPLTVREVARGVAKRGYRSRSQSFVAYLGRVLRKSQRFVRDADGLWTVLRPSTFYQAVQVLQ